MQRIKITLQFAIFAGCAMQANQHCIKIYFISVYSNTKIIFINR